MAGDYPAFSALTRDYPSEWLPFAIISGIITLVMLVLDVYVIIQHKKFSTKFPIQFLCTLGILQVFPFYSIMSFVSLLIPRAADVLVFFTEVCEAFSFIFFLKLVLVFMGGKKASKVILKGEKMHLNIPPICCFICLPQVKFTRKFFMFCEALIALYALFCVFVGFIELMLTLDGDDTYPATAVNGIFASVYHTILILLLLFAIYGLSGIYHSAEDKLKHRGIVKKFIVYKAFTLISKLEDIILGSLVHHGTINDENFGYNKTFTAALRMRNIYCFIVVLQASISFPLAVYFYSTADYITEDDASPGKSLQNSSAVTNDAVVTNEAVITDEVVNKLDVEDTC